MTDGLIDDAVNTDRRLRIKDRMVGRRDIKEHAADLISYQDGSKTLSQIALPTPDYALGRYIARTISAPCKPDGESTPVGVKLPLLYFSPFYHLYMARAAKQQIVPNLRAVLPHLPKTVTELEDHLHKAMGGTFHNSALFQSIVGVPIKPVAEFLFDLRGSAPMLFLFLLSLEFEEALKMMPALRYRGGQNPATIWRERYFADANCTIIEVFQIIRSVRHGTAIIETLGKNRNFTVNAVTELSNERTKKQSKIVLKPKPVQRSSIDDRDLLRRGNCTTYALRKIACLDIDRHKDPGLSQDQYRFEKQDSDLRTLSKFCCLTGPNTEYSRTVLGDFVDQHAQNLPIAPAPQIMVPEKSDINVARLSGSGGFRQGDLAAYYGLDGPGVAIASAIEIGDTVSVKISKSQLAVLANAILEAASWCKIGVSPVRSEHVARAMKAAGHTFPKKGEFGHCTGFALSSWENLEHDKALWTLLVKSKFSFDPYVRQFLEGRRYFMELTHDVKDLRSLRQSARIVCYLAQSVGLLSGDPIWIRLQERVRVMLQITLKAKPYSHDRRQSFGTGPKALGELIAKLEPVPLFLSSSAIH